MRVDSVCVGKLMVSARHGNNSVDDCSERPTLTIPGSVWKFVVDEKVIYAMIEISVSQFSDDRTCRLEALPRDRQ